MEAHLHVGNGHDCVNGMGGRDDDAFEDNRRTTRNAGARGKRIANILNDSVLMVVMWKSKRNVYYR